MGADRKRLTRSQHESALNGSRWDRILTQPPEIFSLPMNRRLRSDFFSLSPREARPGREPERGEIDKKRILSPTLSSSGICLPSDHTWYLGTPRCAVAARVRRAD